MSKQNLGFAVYVTAFKQQRPFLEKMKGQGTPVFTSLHIGEEVSASYVKDVEEMCNWLYENDFWVIADVSPLTLERFEEDTLASLARRLHLDNLRLDFGFDLKDIEKENDCFTFSYNASTILNEDVKEANTLYMHNFYPRPETGLDVEFFQSLNKRIKGKSGQVLAFVSGDEEKRGPIYEGLPTLEKHRYLSPYAQSIDLVKKHEVDKVFLGDIKMSEFELDLIIDYLTDQVIRIPVQLTEEHDHLYNNKYTVRVDSPKTLLRVQESREFAQQGKVIEPDNQLTRLRGSVTIDNKHYKRYSGEVQITKSDYPKDKRVNVIGQIKETYHLLIDNLSNGESFMFIPEKS